MAKEMVKNVNGAAVNYVTEIMMTYNSVDFANINRNPITVLKEEGGVKIKAHSSSYKGVDYSEYCDLVKEICGMDIYIDAKDLPKLEDGEFYWSQLEGLKVITKEGVLLGKVSQLMETGANDVLVVRGCEGSYDREERLIPYVPDQFVLNIDLDKQEMVVDWDPDF